MGAGSDFDSDLAADGRDFGICAQDGVRDGDEQVVDEVAAVAFEVGMGFFFDEDEEVAVDTVVRAGAAFAAKGELHAFGDSCGDIEFNDLFPFDDAVAMTVCAFVLDDFSRASAVGAGGRGLHLS